MLITEFQYLKQPIEGYALCLIKSGVANSAILYNPKEILSLEDFKEKTNWLKAGIKAIKFSSCGFHTVTTAIADKGYGPFIYDCLFTFVNNFVAPDRTSISSAAESLWKFNFNNRKEEFEIIPITRLECKHGYNPYDPEDYTPHEKYIDSMYKIKSPVNYGNLVQNHLNFLEEYYSKTGKSQTSIESSLQQQFQKKFSLFV